MFGFAKKKPVEEEKKEYQYYVCGKIEDRFVSCEIIGDFIGKHSPVIFRRQGKWKDDDQSIASGTLAELLSMLKDPVVRIVNPESGDFFDL